jgi:hypothetical protein
MKLFNRKLSVQAGSLFFESTVTDDNRFFDLRVQFTTEKNGAKDPNTLQMKIFNLSEASRKKIKENDVVILTAGYEEATGRIFGGEILEEGGVNHIKESTDWVTVIKAKDGGKNYSSKRINESLGADSSVTDAIRKVAEALGIGLGNLEDKISSGSFPRNFKFFQYGTVLSGKASDILDELLTSAGLEWSIQDGQLQVLEPLEVIRPQAIKLSQSTGLIGSPEIGDKGVVKARSLLQPELWPGRQVDIESAFFEDGFFKVNKTTHFGDTFATDWYTDIEATRK